VVIVTRAPSSNADLGNLSAATGGGANIPLNPAPFSGATVSYSGTVAHEVMSGTVTATAADTAATIVVNGSAVASGSPAGPFALNVGANVFTVTVTAQDGTTVKHYTVTIVRAPSGNADLGNLSAATGGGANIPLNPAPFNGATVSYSGTVAHEVVSGTVTATAADTAATIVVNGSAVASGSPAGPFVLNVGANVFTVTVTAQDGTTVKSYTVTIVRAPLTGIAGVVYNDVNGNARLDGGEVGLAGVAVALQQNGVVVATTATHSQGEYLFANVVPGASIVQITLPVGFGASFLEQVVNAVTGVLIESANFGLTENGSIAGVVFVDQDTNHLQGTGELGVAGVSIELLEGGSVRQSQTTDVNGIYRFTGVPVGSYRLRLALPVGYVSTVGNEAEITLSSGFTAKSNFSVQLQGSLSGLLYEDRNGNQRPDASEPGVGGVSVTLFQNGGVVQSVNTGAEGYYQFLGLAAGLYTVQASVPDALVANGVVEVAVNLDGIGAAAVNFGYQSRGVVSGIVYQDLNNNQQQDMTEPGLEGVRLEAVQGGNVLGAVVSQTDGSYRIAGLPPGTYLLRLVLPAGFAPVTPQEEEIFLTGGNGQNVGFGLLPVSTIAGMVFEDLNGDGVRQFFEPGMGNVRLAIYGAGVDTLFRTFDDVYVREVRSAGDGSYQFLNQAIDSYDVVVDGLASYTHSTPSQVAVNLGQFWTAAASFGFQRTNRVAATTYEDFDGNGRQGMDEPPLANLPVVLVNQSAGVMGSGLLGAQTTYSATTSSVGFVSFRDVLAGDYEVRTVPPSNSYVAPRTLANFSIAPDGTASEQFGFFQIGTVSGSVFNDVDGNGKRAEVEAGMAGLIVEILNVDDSVRATRVTATDGKFRFTALPAGSYRVRVAGPSGYASTSLNPAAFTLTDAGIGAAAFVDLGFATTDSITGRVFSDINKNRSQDAGEIGVAGTTVTLRRAGQTDRTAKTAVDGSFLFSATAAGDFQLEVTLPPDFIPTTALVADGTLAVDRAGAVTFGIRPNLPNLAPVLQPIADQSAAEGSAISLQSVATDQDDTVLVYAATGLPAGLTIDSGSGLISGVLGTGSAGSYAVEVRVSDPATAESRTSFTFIVVSPTALEPEVEPQIDNRIYLPAVQR
jgi:protocatechuate 3,4-dioxygenase beta subunit